MSARSVGGSVVFERDALDGRIGSLTLDHAGKLNAIDASMWRELGAIAASLDGLRPALRALIVRGAGGHFAAGADIAEFPALRSDERSLRAYHEGLIAPALQALLATDVPLVAQIEGRCIGGGLEIACCCDLRVASADASFGAPIARLGFPMAPDELAVVLGAAGRATTAELLLEAGWLDAATALRRGLVHRVADDAAAEARATALRIAALPVEVARANKRTLRQLGRGTVGEAERAAHFGYARSAAHREGVDAFLSQRPPRFDDEDPA